MLPQNITPQQLAVLQSTFPECLGKQGFDFLKLAEILGESQTKNYGLHWPGKAEAINEISLQSPLQLSIDPERSLQLEQAKHQFIEGENLEVLRIMQATHQATIKMIYIDPPYNTRNVNFVYDDDFSESQSDYQSRLNNSLSDFYNQKNLQSSGRIHSNWLSMMYPRLVLAQNLLREDGIIFISIDDVEQANLRLICDEIFGEENFVANIIRQCKVGSGHDSSTVAIEHDYVLAYAKNKSKIKFHKAAQNTDADPKYKLEDAHIATRGRYYLRDLDYKGTYSESMDYEITAPDNTPMFSGGAFGKPNTWRWSRKQFDWGITNDFIVFKQNKGKWKVYIKQYQFVDRNGEPHERTLPYRATVKFLNAAGSNEIGDIFGNKAYFSFPKSTELLRYLINMVCDKNDIILDFFAGSSTTAHAVLAQNEEDNGERQFICVQIPDPLEPNNPALQEGFKTIADVSYERIRRVIQKMNLTEVGLQVMTLKNIFL